MHRNQIRQHKQCFESTCKAAIGRKQPWMGPCHFIGLKLEAHVRQRQFSVSGFSHWTNTTRQIPLAHQPWEFLHAISMNGQLSIAHYPTLHLEVGLRISRTSKLDSPQFRKGEYNLILELSIKLCPVGPDLHPSFDASSPPGCCPQSHEILLNKGMKYWDLGLNAPSSRTFINYSTHSSSDWLKAFTKRKDRANSV